MQSMPHAPSERSETGNVTPIAPTSASTAKVNVKDYLRNTRRQLNKAASAFLFYKAECESGSVDAGELSRLEGVLTTALREAACSVGCVLDDELGTLVRAVRREARAGAKAVRATEPTVDAAAEE
jgi:hypothetical protein